MRQESNGNTRAEIFGRARVVRGAGRRSPISSVRTRMFSLAEGVRLGARRSPAWPLGSPGTAIFFPPIVPASRAPSFRKNIPSAPVVSAFIMLIINRLVALLEP